MDKRKDSVRDIDPHTNDDDKDQNHESNSTGDVSHIDVDDTRSQTEGTCVAGVAKEDKPDCPRHSRDVTHLTKRPRMSYSDSARDPTSPLALEAEVHQPGVDMEVSPSKKSRKELSSLDVTSNQPDLATELRQTTNPFDWTTDPEVLAWKQRVRDAEEQIRLDISRAPAYLSQQVTAAEIHQFPWTEHRRNAISGPSTNKSPGKNAEERLAEAIYLTSLGKEADE